MGILAFTQANKSEVENARHLRFIGPYIKAWKEITSRRWIFCLFGFAAALSILGYLMNFVFPYHHSTSISLATDGRTIGSLRTLHGNLPLLLWRDIEALLGHFFPGIALGNDWGAGVMLGLAIIVLLPYVNRCLAVHADDPEYGPHIRFVKSLIPFILVLAVICFVGFLIMMNDWSHRSAVEIVHGVRHHHSSLLSEIATIPSLFSLSLLKWLVVTPVLIGGLAGSLKRNALGGSITAESSLIDSVRTFKPIAGVYLILYIVRNVIGNILMTAMNAYRYNAGIASSHMVTAVQWLVAVAIILASVLLMIAPYAAASGERSAWDSAKESIGIWSTKRSNPLYFLAFGVALLTIPTLIASLLASFTAVRLFGALLYILWDLIEVMISIFAAIAVWEFYEQIRPVPQTTDEIVDEVGP
jgi:hypothetical protein